MNIIYNPSLFDIITFTVRILGKYSDIIKGDRDNNEGDHEDIETTLIKEQLKHIFEYLPTLIVKTLRIGVHHGRSATKLKTFEQ